MLLIPQLIMTKVRSHQVECSQHDVEGVHLWSDQLLSVHLHLHTVAEELQQHLDVNTHTHTHTHRHMHKG